MKPLLKGHERLQQRRGYWIRAEILRHLD